MAENISFADITTIGVGGSIQSFIEPTTRVAFIEAVENADEKGLPLCVIGGGSNFLASDKPFQGVVVRDARREMHVLDEAAPVEDAERIVHVQADAGCNWDDFVQYSLDLGLEGVEALSGIPGTVGASVVQNIGAYGQEVSSSVVSVEVWDRKRKISIDIAHDDLQFGYRSSLLKQSMYEQVGKPNSEFFPTPRYVVLSVTFAMRHSDTGVVAFEQLAKTLDVPMNSRIATTQIRNTVLQVRANKGMLEDISRYNTDVMKHTRRESYIHSLHNTSPAVEQEDNENALIDYDRHSCGSFFMNPIINEELASKLPSDAPRFEITQTDGSKGFKVSAAWLIDHAGFTKGFHVDGNTAASLSTKHTLALTNRGTATFADIMQLAQTIQKGVYDVFGIHLMPEPVIVDL